MADATLTTFVSDLPTVESAHGLSMIDLGGVRVALTRHAAVGRYMALQRGLSGADEDTAEIVPIAASR